MLDRLRSSKLGEFVDAGTSAAIFRIFVAFFMLYGHGWGKLMSVFGGEFQFLDPIGIGPTASLILAAFAEGICSLLIIAGFWTRLASLILTINMAVAVFLVHLPGGDWFGDMELP
ncbi:MAG: DoxX family membrane protein, partial [Aliifodinibius sp.]|nr:DoxX family protein [Fodinibius sp.]NIV16368.1 DoxX family membrane protein [Fodinibius sp.]NIY30340.1 DoxX family membrane protein [Fodinibius sp.]